MASIFELVVTEEFPTGIEVRTLHPYPGFAVVAPKHSGIGFGELSRFAETHFCECEVHDMVVSKDMLNRLGIEPTLPCCVVTTPPPSAVCYTHIKVVART